MDEFAKVIGVALLAVAGLFVVIILSTLIGGICGWCVGLIFEDSMAAAKSLVRITATDFEFGAALGFIGGFFKTTVSKS